MKPKAGDLVLHHGRKHEIIGFRKKPYMVGDEVVVGELAFFRNARFMPICNAAELKWSEEDGAWFLPGRLLCKDERTVINAMMGAWPAAEAHLAARKILDVEGPLADHVSMDALKTVIRKRRLKRGFDLTTQKPMKAIDLRGLTRKELKEALDRCETAKAFEERVEAYADACLAHCEQIRAFRKGDADDTPLPPNDGSPEAVKVRRVPGGGAYNVRGGSNG